MNRSPVRSGCKQTIEVPGRVADGLHLPRLALVVEFVVADDGIVVSVENEESSRSDCPPPAPLKGVQRVVVCVDFAERESRLFGLVERCPLFEVQVKKLPAGDYYAIIKGNQDLRHAR